MMADWGFPGLRAGICDSRAVRLNGILKRRMPPGFLRIAP